MELLFLIFLCKVVLCTIFLSYAAFSDMKTREVSNLVWKYFAPLVTIFSVYELLLGGSLLHMLFSVGMTCMYAFGLFYFKVVGGADAKALMCIGLAFPFWPFTQVGGFAILVFATAGAYLIPNSIHSLIQKHRKLEYTKNVPLMPYILVGFLTLIAIWLIVYV